LGSAITRPGSSTVAAASDSAASSVRIAMRRCAAFGTLTLPSGKRASPDGLAVAAGASRCSPLGPCAPGAAWTAGVNRIQAGKAATASQADRSR